MLSAKMISNKRAEAGVFSWETIARIILALILLFAAFSIGKKVAGVIFGKSETMDSFNQLTKDINSLQLDSNEELVRKPTFISLDSGSAIVGFSRNTQEFRCYGCEAALGSSTSYRTVEQGPIFYSIQKPSNQECNDKPCVCFCKKDFKKGELAGDKIEITCGSFVCGSLNTDIYSRISLEGALRNNGITLGAYPYWENGFFFNRRQLPNTNANMISNGMTIPNDERKLTISIEKKRVSNQVYVAACMGDLHCIQDALTPQAAS